MPVCSMPALHLQRLVIVLRLLCQPHLKSRSTKFGFRLEWENGNKRGQNSLSKMFGEIV